MEKHLTYKTIVSDKKSNTYYLDNKIKVKIVPRGRITHPLFVGYRLPSVASNIDEVIQNFNTM
jgi:hypothetical protein